MEISTDIKPSSTILTSAYVDTAFDDGKEALESEGFEIIGLRDNAVLRMQEGANSYISQYGNWTREGVVYVPKKGVYLVRSSPIMANAKEATDCHRNGNEFYLTDEQVESALVDSVKLTGESIKTDKFIDNEVAVFAFGDSAEAYGNFLKENGIKNMLVYLASLGKKPFVIQLWFLRLDDDSELNSVNRYLNHGYRVRGVRSSGEASAQNFPVAQNSELYTPEQIRTALGKANPSGIEGILFKALK